MNAASGSCANCGEVVPSGTVCPSCGKDPSDLRHPRGVIAVLVLLLVLGFAVTGAIVRGFDARREQLAERWFARGNRDLARGAAAQAVDEFQTALAHSRDSDEYRLKLALALVAAGRLEEARAHLLNLWERRPGDAVVNLELARVYAGEGEPNNAIRYYHAAIYGLWEGNPLPRRRLARYELVEYLLRYHQVQAAQAELIALSGEKPTGPEEQMQLATLLMQAGETQRAFDEFRAIYRKDNDNADAALGAAKAAFALGEYKLARNYGYDAAKQDPKLETASNLARRSEQILRIDPLARGLNTTERARRAFALYKTAVADLQECATSHPNDAGLQEALTKSQADFPKLRERALKTDPDLRDSVVRWSYDAVTNTARVCGSPTEDKSNLLLLANEAEKEQ